MSRSNIRECPLCGAPSAAPDAPFCSRGCRDRDLLHWLGDGYVMPGRALTEDDAEGLDSAEPRPL